jgi:hypothetical protein
MLQVNSDKKASKSDLPMKRPSLSISPLKNKNDIVSPKSKSKNSKEDLKSLSRASIPSRLIKVPLNFKTRSDQMILWNTLPSTIRDLGKVWNHVYVHNILHFQFFKCQAHIVLHPIVLDQQAVSHRNVAFLAAVRALEEASAAEGVIHCMRYTFITLLRFALYLLLSLLHSCFHLSML